MKKLTIIIPIYNAEKYISICIKSIIRSDKNFEILLVNDGSTDQSGKICEDLANNDSRIRVIHKKNAGVSSARNEGLRHASGEYIMFVDADDMLNKDWDFILKELKNDDIYYFSKKLNQNINKEELLKYIIGFNPESICIAGPFSKIFRKDFLEKNKIKFNEKLINGEDMLFNVECLVDCEKYKIKTFSFYQYRNFIGSTTKKFDNRIFESDKIFQEELKNILDLSDIDEKLIQNIVLYSKQMAICVFVQRISFLKKFSEAKKFYKYIYDEPYNYALNKKNIVNKKCSFLLILIKYKLEFISYIICKIIYWIKNQKKEGYYFSKI